MGGCCGIQARRRLCLGEGGDVEGAMLAGKLSLAKGDGVGGGGTLGECDGGVEWGMGAVYT